MTHAVFNPAPISNPRRVTALVQLSTARLISRGDARFEDNPRRWSLHAIGSVETEGRQLRPATIMLNEDTRERSEDLGSYMPSESDDPDDLDDLAVSLSTGQWRVVQDACLSGRPHKLKLTMVIDMDVTPDNIEFLGNVIILGLEISAA